MMLDPLLPIAPQYSVFLGELPQLFSKLNKEQHREKFELIKNEIQGYFEYENKQGIHRRLSPEHLVRLLEEMKPFIDNPEQELAFPPLPELVAANYFDCSELFFTELREKLLGRSAGVNERH